MSLFIIIILLLYLIMAFTANLLVQLYKVEVQYAGQENQSTGSPLKTIVHVPRRHLKHTLTIIEVSF